MSSTRTTVDKNSCDAEIEPSVVRVEGTVDSTLNEAPQASYLIELTELDDCICRDNEFIRGKFELRDGQPG